MRHKTLVESQPDRACPLTIAYLKLIGEELKELDLLYGHLKPEYEKAVEQAATAGGGDAVQSLRGFVVVETLAVVNWSYTSIHLSDRGDFYDHYKEAPKIILKTRTAEALTRYIKWAREFIEELTADRIHYVMFSTDAQRERCAEGLARNIEALTLAAEGAGILRTTLKSHHHVTGLAQRLHRSTCVAGRDQTVMLKHARNLLSITEFNAPRAWELP